MTLTTWFTLLLAALGLVSTLMGWVSIRMYRRERVVTEDVPQLMSVVFGPPDKLGIRQHGRGLIGKYEESERERVALRREVRQLRSVVREQWELLLGTANPEDTGQHRVITKHVRELSVVPASLQEKADSDPPAED